MDLRVSGGGAVRRRFAVTGQHLALLRRMCVGWSRVEFGAPAIDPKRPYGSSFVYGDIAEILGEAYPVDDEDWPDEATQRRMDQLHGETETALQIALSTAMFKEGIYEAGEYEENWCLVAEPAT
jgi:hypothetical protein